MQSGTNCMLRFLAAWVPFFDNMNAIIFLAPISAFDEVLAEDPSVNRLVRCPQYSQSPYTNIFHRKILSSCGNR